MACTHLPALWMSALMPALRRYLLMLMWSKFIGRRLSPNPIHKPFKTHSLLSGSPLWLPLPLNKSRKLQLQDWAYRLANDHLYRLSLPVVAVDGAEQLGQQREVGLVSRTQGIKQECRWQLLSMVLAVFLCFSMSFFTCEPCHCHRERPHMTLFKWPTTRLCSSPSRAATDFCTMPFQDCP